MIFSTNYYLVLVAMGVFGLGDGLANLSVIKNCWKYFPQNKALVNGIIIGGLGLSSAILTPIADYFIINPKGKEPDKDGIYPKEIADRLLNFLYFLAIFFLFLGAIAVAFTFKYELEPNSTDEVFGKGAELEEDEKDQTVANKSRSNMGLLCEGFWSLKNLILTFFCFCGPCKLYIYNYIYSLLLFDY